jgi:hypothetical protein
MLLTPDYFIIPNETIQNPNYSQLPVPILAAMLSSLQHQPCFQQHINGMANLPLILGITLPNHLQKGPWGWSFG